MAYRQRNIPVTSKEEIEVQTDVRLLQSSLIDEVLRQEQQHRQRSHLHLSRTYSDVGLLRPFTDHFLLQEFAITIKDLKESEFSQQKHLKRLQILEGQIHGLLKRDLLIHGECEGSQQWTSYYSAMNEKQKAIIKLQNEKAYSDFKISQLRLRVSSLQLQVDGLRLSLINQQKILEDNKIFSSVYQKITNLVEKSVKKGQDLQALIEKQVVPLVAEYSFNLAQTTKTINRDFNKNPIKETVSNLAKQFDRLLKQQLFDEKKLQETLSNLVFNFKSVKGIGHMKNQFDLSIRSQEISTNYTNMLSLVKSEIQNLKCEMPNLKGVERFQLLLNKLDVGLPLISCNGWINLISQEYKTIQINKDDKQLKELIGTISGQFKRMYLKFPQLKENLSLELITLLESDALVELINGGSIEKLKEIIVHEVQSITVDNVYKYQSSKERETIFHLRVLIKGLLDEFQRATKSSGVYIELDAGLISLLKQQIIDGIDIEAIIGLYRPHCQYIQVPVIVEKPTIQTISFTKGVPIKTEVPVLLNQNKVEVVVINKEVAVYVEKAKDCIITNNVPVAIATQKAYPVQLTLEKTVQRNLERNIELPVIREKAVAMYEREEVVKLVQIQKIVNDIEICDNQVLVQTKNTQYNQIQKIVEKPYYLYQTKHTVRQVQVKVPFIVNQPIYVQVEKHINHYIQKKEIVNITKEVAVEIRVPQIRIVELVQYRDKIIVTNQVKEVVKQICVTKEKQVVRQVPKEIYIERSHFIKGDVVQIIKEVQCFVDKPIIKQILTCRDLQIQKVFPCYITEQIPIITEVRVAAISETVRELEVEKCKIIPIKQEIIKQIIVEKPVHIVVEKEVVRIQTHVIEKIVQKIVEVPRVVQIEKIVQRIVVVPRIIQKIVQVAKIIEKIVFVQVPVLQIVEVQVPQIIIQERQTIITVQVEKQVIVYVKECEIVEVDRIIEKIIERDRIVQVQIERRVPYEVIRQVPVLTYRDRIEYQKVYINDTKVESIEVQVPFNVPEIVPMYTQRPVITENIIEKVIIEKQVYEKPCPIINEVQVMVVKQIIVEKAVENQIILEVPFQNIVYEKCIQIVQVIRQKLLTDEILPRDTKEIPVEIYIEVQKIVHEIHDRLVEVPVNRIVTKPLLIEVPKLINLVHYKQIPIDVPVREERIARDIFQQIKQVQVSKEVPLYDQICRQQIKEITRQVQCYLTQQRPIEISTQVQVRSPVQYQIVQTKAQTIIQQNTIEHHNITIQDKILQRVVEKIIMLPQIVQVVRNIHHISEINHLGLAVDVDIKIQTEKYAGVSNELKTSLEQLLATFKTNVKRQPELKNIISIVEKYIGFVDNWISFPKLIEIPREIIKEVEKERVVLVPTSNKEKQSILSYIIQKLLVELRRIKESHKISLSLDEQILKLFFSEDGILFQKKVQTLEHQLRQKYNKNGQWSQSNPFLINSYINDHLNIKKLIGQSNRIQQSQTQETNILQSQLAHLTNKYNNLLCFNRKLYDDNNKFISTLERYKNHIDIQEYKGHISTSLQFYNNIYQHQSHVMIAQVKRTVQIQDTFNQGRIEITSRIKRDNEEEFGMLIGKINAYQSTNQNLETQHKKLEYELHRAQEEMGYKDNIIKKLEIQIQTKINKLREEYTKNPNLNKEFLEQNKKLQEKARATQRQISAQKQNLQRAKRQFQRTLQNVKRQHERELQRRERQSRQTAQKIKKQLQRQINRLKIELDKMKIEKERYENQLLQTKKKSSEEIKQIRQTQMSSANDKYNTIVTENIELRRKYDQTEFQYEKFKKAALDNNNGNEKEITRLRDQNEKLSAIKIEFDRQKKIGFTDAPQDSNKANQIEKKIKVYEAQIEKYKIKDENSLVQIKNLREKLRRLEADLETARREMESAKKEVQSIQKSRLQSTTYQSGYKPVTSSIVENLEIGSAGTGSVVRSPKSSTYKSGFQRGYVSPIESSMSREQKIQQFGSSSSRKSNQSEQNSNPPYYKSQMTLREFIDAKHSDDNERNMYVTLVMIKVIQKVEQQIQHGIFNSYTPSSIYLSNFNVRGLDKLIVKFGAPITNKNNKHDVLYLSPQVIKGQLATKKSTVFCLGIILDELIHGSIFFKSTDEIINLQHEFKVREIRGEKLNPILKNTLFEMMNKEPSKRLEMIEAKRRLSLQKYITSEGRSSITTSRTGRKLQE